MAPLLGHYNLPLNDKKKLLIKGKHHEHKKTGIF
jgi:hypothetical protein